jgi:hypothetical protein
LNKFSLAGIVTGSIIGLSYLASKLIIRFNNKNEEDNDKPYFGQMIHFIGTDERGNPILMNSDGEVCDEFGRNKLLMERTKAKDHSSNKINYIEDFDRNISNLDIETLREYEFNGDILPKPLIPGITG